MQNVAFKFIGNASVGQAVNQVHQFTQADWKEYDFRQKHFDAHKNTFTIPLLFNERFSNRPDQHKHYDLFKDVLGGIQNLLLMHYTAGRMVRAMLVNLPAEKDVTQHIDIGRSLIESHRVHIPIITNDNVLFCVGNEALRMRVGEVWEIDNTGQQHSVHNRGVDDRVHLIIDWRSK